MQISSEQIALFESKMTKKEPSRYSDDFIKRFINALEKAYEKSPNQTKFSAKLRFLRDTSHYRRHGKSMSIFDQFHQIYHAVDGKQKEWLDDTLDSKKFGAIGSGIDPAAENKFIVRWKNRQSEKPTNFSAMSGKSIRSLLRKRAAAKRDSKNPNYRRVVDALYVQEGGEDRTRGLKYKDKVKFLEENADSAAPEFTDTHRKVNDLQRYALLLNVVDEFPEHAPHYRHFTRQKPNRWARFKTAIGGPLFGVGKLGVGKIARLGVWAASIAAAVGLPLYFYPALMALVLNPLMPWAGALYFIGAATVGSMVGSLLPTLASKIGNGLAKAFSAILPSDEWWYGLSRSDKSKLSQDFIVQTTAQQLWMRLHAFEEEYPDNSESVKSTKQQVLNHQVGAVKIDNADGSADVFIVNPNLFFAEAAPAVQQIASVQELYPTL